MTSSSGVNVLYRQKSFPVLQNRVYASQSDAISCVTGDIEVVEDLQTGLVRNIAFDPSIIDYDANYDNEQGHSTFFKDHLEGVSEIIQRTMQLSDLVEVGCGKGLFLELLSSKGATITGFDPTYEGSNPKIEKRYFEPGVMAPSNGLILRHVLEHIPDPVSFLERLKVANGEKGLIYIEVPCFDWICENKVWFDIFYEHVNYFRLSDFDRIFGRILEKGRLFGGQYLYVVADLASLGTPEMGSDERLPFPEDFLNIPTHPEKNIVIWGGASKGVIFALLMMRAGYNVKAAVDINPAKQGKYLPVTGVPVISPDEAMASLQQGSDVYVMNSNYTDEIRRITSDRFNLIETDTRK
ncbi:class I SAM-dependent methyltransferase [Thalassospira indica]|uniref:Methyltransferase domain-containing protein n=1 Tax=Thalassospira indica TaxID=1891279 RepID=A0ABN5NHH4_9PROT|nr:class I SAM-dependent methyltransferase [Thalassospira indica]AXO14660.1 methyltransferase domain-containing protein [Thalassospira indica]OAZ12651.1 methyltransferase [Thalassospira profundimaris]